MVASVCADSTCMTGCDRSSMRQQGCTCIVGSALVIELLLGLQLLPVGCAVVVIASFAVSVLERRWCCC
eukprot:15297249-Alexandrium_andersonii.AAC.1